jgi:ArsR family transcriptional regulator
VSAKDVGAGDGRRLSQLGRRTLSVDIAFGYQSPYDPAYTVLTVGTVVASTDLGSTRVELSRRLGALADSVRLSVIEILVEGERCVCELLERVPVAPNVLSYHLGVLRKAGLVRSTRRGRWVDYRLDPQGFAALWADLALAGIPPPSEAISRARCGSTNGEKELMG